MGALGVMDPAFRETIRILMEEGSGHVQLITRELFASHVRKGEYNEARKMLQSIILPRLNKATYDKIMTAGGGESWANRDDIKAANLFHKTDNIPMDTLFLGNIPGEGQHNPEIRFSGEGHVMTIAPTGAGKGQRYILPNTLKYHGPILCVDPKGENYKTTAWRRDCFGPVYKFAPFDDDTDCFNPLDFIESWEDARQIAELLVIPSGRGEPFWDISAQSLVRGLVMFVKKTREPELQNLREVCRLLSPSANEREAMLDEMRKQDDERFLELANELEDMSENLRKSVYSVANSHMQPWRDERIAAATSSTADEWDPELVYENMHLEEIAADTGFQKMGPRVKADGTLIRGMVHSIFLILPPSEIASYGSVLRVILGLHIIGIQKKSAELQNGSNPFRPSRSVLFLLDELPQLGYMKILENAVAIARSAGIKLWFFAQDLSQLKHTYPKWESILSNCKVQIFFKPGDLGTAEYLSRRLGLRKDIMGGQSPLASPQQLMGADFEDKVIILKSGVKPIKATQPMMFFEDPMIQGLIDLDKNDALATPLRKRKIESKPKKQ